MMLWKGDQLPRVTRETKLTLRGKWESVFSGRHKDNVPQETHVVSVMTLYLLLATGAVVRDEKDDRLLPHPIRRQSRLTARDKSSKESGNKEESSSDKKERNSMPIKILQNQLCKFWHPPVCLNYKSEKGCVYGDKLPFPTC